MLVKTLYGKRKTHKVSVDIMTPLEKVKEQIAMMDPVEMAQYHSVKLIYPMGKLKTLPLD